MISFKNLLVLIAIICSSFYANADVARIAREFQAKNLDKALSLANHYKYKQLHQFLKMQDCLYKQNGKNFEEITTYLIQNPQQAQRNSLMDAAETSLSDDTSASAIIKWYSHNKPRSPKGYYYYYRAAMNKIKDSEKLNEIIKNAWIYSNFNKKQNETFLTRHKKILNEEDHADKISNMLWYNKIDEAKQYLHLVGKEYQQAFKARIAILNKDKNVEHEFHKVKGSYKYEPGLLYSYLKLHMKAEPNSELINLHLKAPRDFDHPKEWWAVKNYFIRELIEKKNYKDAYKIAANHSNIDKGDLVDAEWLAGWLALRFNHKPEAAVKHFESVYNNSKSSISLARGSYWLGRAYNSIKNKELANKWFKEAANYGFTYYGILAQYELGNKELLLSKTPTVTADDKKNLAKNPYAQIAHMLSFTDRNELIKLYSKEAFFAAKSKGEVALLNSMLAPNLNTNMKVEVAKLAAQSGTLLIKDAFPTPFKIPSNVKENAFVYAIMRQESVFDHKGVSSANANGLMQIIDPTAKAICKDMGIKFVHKSLFNPDYNIKLGSYHLESLLGETKSYIKTASIYNAGPVAKKWDARFGDPNNMKLRQVVDFVELIPYEQTRTYVQRVLENLQIYRQVIDKNAKLNIAHDLMRR